MSSLLIEGGRPISGSIEVEGNKNAALPLLAACLLTTEECVLTNMPRIGDVEVMAKLLMEVGAEVHGLGTTTIRVRCREIKTSEPSQELVGKLRGSVLLLGPLLARIGPRDSRHAWRRFSGAPHHRHARRCTRESRRDGSAFVWTCAGSAARPARGVDVPGRSVGHRNGDRGACGGDDRRRHRDSPRRHRAARRGGVRVSAEHGRGHHGRRIVDHSRRRDDAAAGHDPQTERRLHRGGKLGCRCCGHRRGNRGSRRAGRRRRRHRVRAEAHESRVHVRRRPDDDPEIEAGRGREDHDGLVAELSERFRQPRHRARDAGGRAHAHPRLDVRTAPVRARAAQRDARRFVPLRSRTGSSSPGRAS